MRPLRHFPLRLVAAMLLLNLLMVALATYMILSDRQEHERRARVSTYNLAKLAERDLNAEFDRIALTLDLIAEEVGELPSSARLDPVDVRRVLAHRVRQLPEIDSMWFSGGRDAAPVAVRGAGAGTPRDDVQSLSRHHRERPEAGILMRMEPARADRVAHVSISRSVSDRLGRFLGVVSAELPMSFFTGKFATIDLGANGSIEFRLLDGDQFAHPSLDDESLLGRLYPGLDVRQVHDGTYMYRSPTDGVERLYGYQRSASYPFQIEVAQAADHYLDEWHRDVGVTVLAVLIFVPISLVFTRLIWRSWRGQVQTAQALQESESRLRFAIDGAGYCLWEWGLRDGRFTVSPRGKEMLGLTEHEIADRIDAWAQRVHPEDRHLLRAELRRHLRGQRSGSPLEVRLRHREGQWVWVLVRAMVTNRDGRGRALRMIGTLVDMTERHERMEALKLAASVYELSDEGVVVTNSRNQIISVNPAFTTITGYELKDVVGRNPSMLSAKTHPKAFYESMWKSLKETGSWSGEVVNRKKSGEVYIEQIAIKCILDNHGRLTHHLAVLADVTARRQAEQRMHHLALHDALTDLPNRVLLSERIGQALLQAQRERTQLALVYFDLDKFKPVNDEHGHAIGDLLLQAVAARVRDCLRASDTLARLGGDEFVVLLSGFDDEAQAKLVTEKICQALQQPFTIADHVFHIGGSMGVAVYPQHGDNEECLMQHADMAMYEAKRLGGSRVVVYRASLG